MHSDSASPFHFSSGFFFFSLDKGKLLSGRPVPSLQIVGIRVDDIDNFREIKLSFRPIFIFQLKKHRSAIRDFPCFLNSTTKSISFFYVIHFHCILWYTGSFLFCTI